MNKKINKSISNAEDNESAIVNAAIKLSDDERSARNKTTSHQRYQIGKANSKTSHKHNRRSTRDGKHMQFNIKPSIAIYTQHDNKPMITYDSGAYGH